MKWCSLAAQRLIVNKGIGYFLSYLCCCGDEEVSEDYLKQAESHFNFACSMMLDEQYSLSIAFRGY